MTPGGGGWGDPLERPPDAWSATSARAWSRPGARRDVYGVVLGADGGVDEGATSDARADCAELQE